MSGAPYPLRGLVIVCVVFISTAIGVGTAQYAYGLFIPPLMTEFGWSRAQIGMSLSFAAVGGLAAPFIGRAMDRVGTRPILVFCICVSGASLLLRPLVTELWHWYLLSFFQFVTFAGMTTLPTGKLVGAWFPNARGRMLGIAVMGNNFGGLVVPVSVAAILAASGWRASFVTLGIASFAVALLAWFVVRETPQQAAPGGTTGAAPNTEGATASEALRSRRFYALAVVITLGYFTYSTVLSHMLAHLQNKGMTATSAALAMTGLATGGLIGKLLFGTLADKRGARFSASFNLAGQAVLAAAVASLDVYTALIVMLPFFGIVMGGFGVVSTLLVQDAFGLRHFGAIMGLLNIGTVLAFGLGPVIAGLSVDWTGSYSGAFFLVACFFATGAFMVQFAAPKPSAQS